ncbi:nickel-type superoxide dismutase maturation protease [Candidatus Daviesbacteria bacterium]|nr:nickel-type superoxide dismutase maturation protease [Candidatus Daviesbacteria bacterium]
MLLLGRFKIYGHSMEPELRENQQIIASSTPYWFTSPRKGDVVVVKHPQENRVIIKRITRVDHNTYWVLGDNPRSSSDSRHFGPITKNNILAKIIFVF